MPGNKSDLIREALGAAETSIKLAKQLLSEMEGSSVKIGSSRGAPPKKEKEGVEGNFDGEQMITEAGDKYPVPANYASKSLLIVGDKLKLVEEGSEKRFKQIEHVKRHRTNGILAKKEGKWKAVTPEGSYKILPEAVEHFGGEVGDEIVLHLPAGNLVATYGALESVNKKTQEEPEVKEVKTEQTQLESTKPAQKVEKTVPKPIKPKPSEPKKIEKPKKQELPPKSAEPPAEKPKPQEPVKEATAKTTVSEDELT